MRDYFFSIDIIIYAFFDQPGVGDIIDIFQKKFCRSEKVGALIFTPVEIFRKLLLITRKKF